MNQIQQYELIARALCWMAEHQSDQPGLERLSAETGLSPHHLQRTFQSWAGVSPKQFLKSLTRQAALERLLSGSSVLDSALESGLTGPGRLHDLLVTTEALSPGEARRRGKGVTVRWGTGSSPFGLAIAAWTARGLNFLGFCTETGEDAAIAGLKSQWHGANFVADPGGAQRQLDTIFSDVESRNIRLWLRGSPFQLKVWEALLAIPEGAHATYGQIAAHIGQPEASRAVGAAIGRNPVAWIIPCHRVIRSIGAIGGYRWGRTTKQAMIGFEAARCADRSELQVHLHA